MCYDKSSKEFLLLLDIKDSNQIILGNMSSLWQGKVSSPRMATFSAIYDDRFVYTSYPDIAVVVFGYFEMEPNDIIWMLWFNSTRCIVSSIRKFKYYHGSHTVLKFRNNLKDQETPIAVSATVNGTMMFNISVIKPKRPLLKRDFNSCLGVIYTRNSNDKRYHSDSSLIAWIEIHRLFGVSAFTMYNQSTPSAWNKAISYYAKKGIMEVHQISPMHDKEGPYEHQSLVINDCLHRNMYSFKYTLVTDLDEVIMPRGGQSLTTLMEDIEQQYQCDIQRDHFSIQNSFFFLDSPYIDNSSDVEYIRFRYRHTYSSYPFTTKINYVSPKSITNPLNCVASWPHGCLETVNGSKVIGIERETATVNHYRYCLNPAKGRTKQFCKEYNVDQENTILDNTTLKIKDKLLANIAFVKEQIKLHGV